MRLIEQAIEHAQNPIDNELFEQRRQAMNELHRRFLANEISIEEFQNELAELPQIDQPVTLKFAGPFYGFLRRIGFNEEDAAQVAEEERAHFFAAQRQGLEPEFNTHFTYSLDEQGQKKIYYQIYVSYDIPDDQKEAQEAILTVITAPPIMSEDDKAKLP